MQETYFVWSFVSEIYMVKKREMKSLIIFLASVHGSLAVGKASLLK